MKRYEGIFIYPPEAGPEVRKNQEKTLEEIVKRFQGAIVQKNEWGRRPLGYPLKKFREGHFWVVDFDMPPANMTELRKTLELQEDLLKFMLTIKNLKADKKPADKIPAVASVGAAPSAPAPIPAPAAPHHRT